MLRNHHIQRLLIACPVVFFILIVAANLQGGSTGVEHDLLEQAAEDVSRCSKFTGFLLNECLEQKQTRQSSPALWTEDELKNGLWKTEKALADMEIRQYKNSRQREAAHKAQNQRLDKFKKRMEGALTLIHQIQDEMGTSHSELVQRLKDDLQRTKSKISGYIDDGTTQLKEKLDVLNRREIALTKRLLEMIDAQSRILTQEADGDHQEEMKKNDEVKGFIEGVHDEQRREDARILSEITFIKSAIQTLRQRQGRDYQSLDDIHKKMVAKMADNVEEARTNLEKHVSMIKANVSSQIQLDKDRMESKIQDLSTNGQNRVLQLDDKSKDLVRNLQEKLSSHKEYQSANNTQQRKNILDLKQDLLAYNLTSNQEIEALKENSTRFQEVFSASADALRTAESKQRADVLSLITSVIQSLDNLQQTSTSQVHLNEERTTPEVSKITSDINSAISEIEQKRNEDYSELKDTFEERLATLKDTNMQKAGNLDRVYSKSVNNVAAKLGEARTSVEAFDNQQKQESSSRMQAWKAKFEANNTQQGTELNSLTRTVSEGSTKLAGFLSELTTKISSLVTTLHREQDFLDSSHRKNVTNLNESLIKDLAAFEDKIVRLAHHEASSAHGEVLGSFTAEKFALNSLESNLAYQDENLNQTLQSQLSSFRASSQKANSRLQSDVDLQARKRSEWDSRLTEEENIHNAVQGNLSLYLAALQTARNNAIDALRAQLSQSLNSVEEEIKSEVNELDRQKSHSILSKKQAALEVIDRLEALETSLLANSTSFNGKLQGEQLDWHDAEEAKVKGFQSNFDTWKDANSNNMEGFNESTHVKEKQLADEQEAMGHKIVEDEQELTRGYERDVSSLKQRLSSSLDLYNQTEMELLAQSVRQAMMKVEQLGWQLGANGAKLRAKVHKEEEDQEELYSTTKRLLAQIQADHQSFLEQHESELSILESREAAQEQSLVHEALLLRNDMSEWSAEEEGTVGPGVVTKEEEMDGKLRAMVSALRNKLKEGEQEQKSGRGQEQEKDSTLHSDLSSDLAAMQAALDSDVSQEGEKWKSANSTIYDLILPINREVSSTELRLEQLDRSMDSAYAQLRAKHEQTVNEIKEKIQDKTNSLKGEGDVDQSKQDEEISRLITQSMSRRMAELLNLQDQLKVYISHFKNDMSSQLSVFSHLHQENLDSYEEVDRLVKESKRNVSSSLQLLSDNLAHLKLDVQEGSRQLSDAEEEEKGTVVNDLQRLRNNFTSTLQDLKQGILQRIVSLRADIVRVQGKLESEDAVLEREHDNDDRSVRSKLVTGVNQLDRSAQSILQQQSREVQGNINQLVASQNSVLSSLDRSTHSLLSSLRNRVQLAATKEANDMRVQDQKFGSVDGKVKKWWDDGRTSLSSLRAKLERIEERVRSRKQRLEQEQATAISQVVAKLERAITAMNATILSYYSQAEQSSTSSLLAQLSSLDTSLQRIKNEQSRALRDEDRDMNQINEYHINTIKLIRNRLSHVLNLIDNFASSADGRMRELKAFFHQSQDDLEGNFRDLIATGTRERAEIRTRVASKYTALRRTFAVDWRYQQQLLERRMEERTKDLERDIANFQRQLESQTAQLQERMKRMKGRDDDMEQDLSKRIDKAKEERRRVERLEEDVWGNYLHAKSALAGLKEDTKEREQSTDASMASLERELNNNQGAADSITRIQQTLAALKTRINELARGVGVKSDGLRTKEADANELGEVATAFLRSELERLQRLLDSSVNERRRIRSQAEGSMRDFQLRLEKFRGDLRQINATWNAYDQP